MSKVVAIRPDQLYNSKKSKIKAAKIRPLSNNELSIIDENIYRINTSLKDCEDIDKGLYIKIDDLENRFKVFGDEMDTETRQKTLFKHFKQELSESGWSIIKTTKYTDSGRYNYVTDMKDIPHYKIRKKRFLSIWKLKKRFLYLFHNNK